MRIKYGIKAGKLQRLLQQFIPAVQHFNQSDRHQERNSTNNCHILHTELKMMVIISPEETINAAAEDNEVITDNRRQQLERRTG